MVRTGKQRSDKYEAKEDGEIVGARFTTQKASMGQQQQVYFSRVAAAEQQAKRLLENAGVNTIETPIYLYFVRELVKLAHKFEARARREEAFRMLDKWRARGMNPDRLTELMQMFGLDPVCRWDVDYWNASIWG